MGDNHVRAKPHLEAFEERYIPEPMSGCWLWIGPLHSNKKEGYGVFWSNYGMAVGEKRVWLAHRAAWEFYKGPIPDFDANGNRILVCHHCDNPACVNPDHLFLGTDKDNVHDAMKKGRHQHPNNPYYKKSEDRHNAKLNPDKVRAIRFMRELDFPAKLLASEYGVTVSNIEAIDQKRIWKHVV